MKKVTLLICNQHSGRGVSDEILDKFRSKLSNNGYISKLVLTERAKHASEIIEKSEYFDIVFSIGGDGTLSEVVSGNLKRKDRLTICPIPSGSCNDVATMLGYKKKILDNLDMAMNGKVVEIDVPTINDQAYIYVAGMGKFLNVTYDTKRQVKKKMGYAGYFVEATKEFFKSPKMYDIEVEADGIRLDGKYSIVMVSNSNHIAGVNGFQKNVLLDDGELEVILCKCKSNTNIIYSFLDYFVTGKNKNLVTFKAHDINLKFRELLEHNPSIDGDKLENNNLTYHISASNKMNFLVPSDYNKRLFLNN